MMAFANFDGNLLNIVLIAIGIAFVVGLVVVVAFKIAHSNKHRADDNKPAAVEATDDHGTTQLFGALHRDFLPMNRNTTYSVGPDGEIAPGTYELKGATQDESDFNMRVNGFVQTLKDGDKITVGAGDTLCPVSETVLIRPVVDAPFEG